MNKKNVGIECHVLLYSMGFREVFDSTGKAKKFYKEVCVDGKFPPKCSTNESYEKNSKDFNPTNQTNITGKILRI